MLKHQCRQGGAPEFRFHVLVRDPALLDRSAVASTLVAGLELAHQGQITLRKDGGFGDIVVHDAADSATAGAEAGS